MAHAETTAEFACSPEQFFKIISDYEKYSDFLKEVKSCKVLKTDGNRKLVEYQVAVIKTFSYRLWMVEDSPRKITWSLESGDIFKISNGSWELTAKGEKTHARYAVEATFGLFVPSPMAKMLVSVNLPGMISAYQKRVAEIYGAR
jgi:ribosome-associated toxin RatA of RatAB toxin-antitoxin module